MPRPSNNGALSPLTFFVICCVFLLALFPSLFIGLIWAPYNYLFPPLPPRTPTSVVCKSPNICTAPSTMSWSQKQFTLPARSRGSYLITDTVVRELPEIKEYKTGLLNLFIQHTSCALSLNENWDEDVRADMSDALDRVVPEDKKGGLYRHDAEGPDDMPAHVKSALIGASVTIPITNGRLNTGTWQGIWYLEFRAYKHSRKVVATIQGEKN
ncbi:UPF0047-domain-containing protein [Corynespora cassiicola Philippines]|uniref:UPF0047-domain-containing protein n=1 Tax=Corynespora cassiicola Philippines TaxID=1448308 RepID=A0A2T2PA47_CORCC|nr:UPF0047-domain-containing protein [Corynespora cassiicola Philippines]